jgi:FixJ family two-component response regulator
MGNHRSFQTVQNANSIATRYVVGRAMDSTGPDTPASDPRQDCASSIEHAVYIIDHDTDAREAIADALLALGRLVKSFPSATEYITYPKPIVPTCLVLDLDSADVNAPEFQRQVLGPNHVPIVLISAHAEVRTIVRAIKAGAIDFLVKPWKPVELLQAVDVAVAVDRIALPRREEMEHLRQRFNALTPREHEVLPLVVGGLLNKQAAAELGISEITLQIHRRNVMRKMRAASLAELVRFADKLEVPVNKFRGGGQSARDYRMSSLARPSGARA